MENRIEYRIDDLVFEWDEAKEKKNIKKHGVNFRMAAHVFFDENLIQDYDPFHSDDENRYIAIGAIDNGGQLLILTVSITERGESMERIRIISARKATNYERGEYYGQNN